jgi:hypothetical protein
VVLPDAFFGSDGHAPGGGSRAHLFSATDVPSLLSDIRPLNKLKTVLPRDAASLA